jgi:fumarate reductase flavoprotein subunit
MMPGNGLTDAVTFGLIAGAKSAAYVGKTGL